MIVSGGNAIDFAPQALSELAPLVSSGYYYGRTGLGLLGHYAAYAGLYRAQPSISTVVDKVAASAARIPLKVWDTTAPTGDVLDLTSPYARLMAKPCPVLSPFAFYRWTVSTFEIYGEAFWYKMRNAAGDVVGLLPMHPARVAVVRLTPEEQATLGYPTNVQYVFTLGGVASAGLLKAPETDVVPFLRYNPENIMRGMSRLEPLRSTLENETAARRATHSWWTRAGRPAVALQHPGELSKDAQDRLRAQFDARFAGADNFGGTAVLEEDMKLTVIQLTAEEMQYIESRKMNMQEVCMVYDIPPPVVHILDHATFSNITEQMRSMYRDTMSPRLEELQSTVDTYVRPEFFTDGQRQARYALDQVLRGDFEARALAVAPLVSNGIYKPSEARVLFDLPDAGPDADKLYGNAALVPLGTPSQKISVTEAAPAPADLAAAQAAQDAPAEELPTKSLSLRSIMGRVGSKAVTRDALVDEHAKAIGAVFEKQRTAAKADGKLTASDWDDELAGVLGTLATATAKSIGGKVAKALGGSYSVDDINDWLDSNAKTSAQSINATTAAQVKAALDAAADDDDTDDDDADSSDDDDPIDGLFDGEVAARKSSISLSRVAMVGGLASLASARQNNAGTKTWTVTAAKPRPSHEAMDGETVGLDDTFSNGMDAPGDPNGGADEVAGCTCELTFSKEDS